MLGRPLLILVAVLVGLAGLAASVSPRESADPSAPGSVAPPRAETATPAPPRGGAVREVSDVPSEPPLRELDAGARGQVVEVETGQRARLSIAADELVSVQIGADGPIESIDPDAPARFDLLYDVPSTQPIRRLDTGRAIGLLRVIPADG